MLRWYGVKVIDEVFRLLADSLRRSGSLSEESINLILDAIRRLEDQPALKRRRWFLERVRRLAVRAVAHFKDALQDGAISAAPLPDVPPPPR